MSLARRNTINRTDYIYFTARKQEYNDMIMSWEFFLLISILLFSINSLLHRVLMKDDKSDPKAQTVMFLGVTGIFSFILALSKGSFNIPDFSLLWSNFLVMVLLSTLAPILGFMAYKLTNASDVSIFMSSQRLWTVLAAILFLNETSTTLKVTGTILVICGIVITTWRKHRIEINKGAVSASLAAFFYGIGYANSFYILQHMQAASFETYATLLPAITLLIFQPATVKKLKFYFTRKNALNITIVCVFDLFATLLLDVAYQVGHKASQLAPLGATQVLFTIILAAIFLKERENLFQKLIGALIIVAGAILIIIK